jgi:hypothetical protein
MGSFLKLFWPPVVVALSASVAFSGYMLNGVPVRDFVFGLWNSLYWITVIMWIAADARQRRKTPCYDVSFLVWVTLYASIPWYAISSRGFLRGIPLLFLIQFLGILPEIAATLMWAVRYR